MYFQNETAFLGPCSSKNEHLRETMKAKQANLLFWSWTGCERLSTSDPSWQSGEEVEEISRICFWNREVS
jgi:hypothetical protein